jgi:glycosyltransferase involved in cell wall biosynthesis
MPVRVLHLAHRFYVGGSERQFVERLRAHPRGYEPLLACFELSGGTLTDLRALGLGDPLMFPLRRSILRLETGKQILRLAAAIRERSVRLVHSTDFTSSLLGLVAARLAGVPIIVNRVDLGHLRPGFGRPHRFVERRVSRAADVVCANAEAVQAVCIADEGCAPERVRVVRNGIDLPGFDALAQCPLDEPLPFEGRFIACVANLWPVKGHQALIEAARSVDARIALVGDGPERSDLLRRVSALGLEQRVFFLGTRYDVPAILARASAFVLPSLAEGLPNAVMEAMAARLPIVASAVGGVPELLGHGRGLLVSPGDAPMLAHQLNEVLSDGEKARRMGTRARAFVETELSIERLRDSLGRLYDAVLERGSATLAAAA